jgi:peptidoglycan/LPS O-acetylase OafA/YrhL
MSPAAVPDRSGASATGGLVPRLPRHIPSLDGLRAVSIVLVFMAHIAGTRGAPAVFDRLEHLGNLGVKVFFVISGFLITTLLLKEFDRTGRIGLKGFYLRRSIRIFPAFYVYVAVILVLNGLGYVALREGDWLHALTYTMNYHEHRAWELNHLWSLAVEEQFYLLWPALLCLLGPRRALVCAAAAVVLAPPVRMLMWYRLDASPSAMTRHFQAVMDSLATGCLLAGCHNWLGARRWYLAVLSSRFFLLLPLAALLAILAIAAGRDRGPYYVAGQTIANLAIAVCIDRYVRFPGCLTGRLLNTRPFVFVGVLSYSLYLWQEPFLNPMDETSAYATFPRNVVFAVLAALASYYLVERPFLKLKPTDGRATAPAAEAAPRGDAPPALAAGLATT